MGIIIRNYIKLDWRINESIVIKWKIIWKKLGLYFERIKWW